MSANLAAIALLVNAASFTTAPRPAEHLFEPYKGSDFDSRNLEGPSAAGVYHAGVRLGRILPLSDWSTNAPVVGMGDALEDLSELSQRQEGHLGAGSVPPSEATLAAARAFIDHLALRTSNPPQVAAAADGEVGLLWEQENGEVEVVFDDGQMSYVVEHDGHTVSSGTVRCDVADAHFPDELVEAII